VVSSGRRRLPDVADAQAAQALAGSVRGSPVPVIAALAANAQGSRLFGLCCDAVVHDRGGRYAASPLWSAPALGPRGRALCALRFCPSFGREVSLQRRRLCRHRALGHAPGRCAWSMAPR
jgi:hypothetical protein